MGNELSLKLGRDNSEHHLVFRKSIQKSVSNIQVKPAHSEKTDFTFVLIPRDSVLLEEHE